MALHNILATVTVRKLGLLAVAYRITWMEIVKHGIRCLKSHDLYGLQSLKRGRGKSIRRGAHSLGKD
jgi:hypothetical protein